MNRIDICGVLILLCMCPLVFSEDMPTEKYITNSFEMRFVYVQPGSFIMGSPPTEPGHINTEKMHEVTLTEGFYMQTTEVTNNQFVNFLNECGTKVSKNIPWWKAIFQKKDIHLWKVFLGKEKNPILYIDGTYRIKKGYERHPIVNVSWYGANAFAEWLSKKEKRTYRLPTEAEWEYACRAGTRTAFYFGHCLPAGQVNYNGKHPRPNCPEDVFRDNTTPVASFIPNSWGLYDMHGNVAEWCQDLQGNYPSEHLFDPKGPKFPLHSSYTGRIIRGGGWGCNANMCRSAFRSWGDPSHCLPGIGLRLVLEKDDMAKEKWH